MPSAKALFPGLGVTAVTGEYTRISDEIAQESAYVLADYVSTGNKLILQICEPHQDYCFNFYWIVSSLFT